MNVSSLFEQLIVFIKIIRGEIECCNNAIKIKFD